MWWTTRGLRSKSNSPNVLIVTKELTARYGESASLRLPDLHIAAGQNTLLLGPSGCGKTTLINLLTGLHAAASGSILIDGVEITALTAANRDQFRGERIGLVMQRLHLINALSVRANLALTQRLAGRTEDHARIDAVLSSLNIAGKAAAMPRNLSQGEAQRVAIARAVLNRPALIIADEPTSALDDANCAAVLALLMAQASENGATLLIATHDARLLPHFAHIVRFAK